MNRFEMNMKCFLFLILIFLLCCSSSGQTVSDALISTIIAGATSADHKFYVQIVRFEPSFPRAKVCGGSIINQHWVLTAAHCVHNLPRFSQLFIEYGDFTDKDSRRYIIPIEKVFVHPGYIHPGTRTPPVNNIALVKTRDSFMEDHFIELCPGDLPPDTLLGACGTGTTSTTDMQKLSEVLMETYFYETAFQFPLLVQCRRDTVCTFSMWENASICHGDFGSPLYGVQCGTRTPECLYGIASYTKSSRPPESTPNARCTGASFFTRLSIYLAWVQRTMISE